MANGADGNEGDNQRLFAGARKPKPIKLDLTNPGATFRIARRLGRDVYDKRTGEIIKVSG